MAKSSRKELAGALNGMITTSSDPSKLAKAIARYLTEERQTKDLDGLMRDIIRMRENDGIIEVTATTAFPLSDQLKRDIRSLIEKQHNTTHIIINEVIDPYVVGGLKLETSEQQLDVTVQAKLHRLKRAIV